MKIQIPTLFSLRYRIAFIVFILEIILLSFVLTFTLSFIEKQTQTDISERHQVIFELVKSIAQDALFAGEFEDLQAFVEKISQDKEIIHIIATNKAGTVVADSKLRRIGMIFLSPEISGNKRWQHEKIIGLGNIFVRFSMESQKEQLENAQEFGFSIALPGIAFIAVVSLLFGSLLTRRLNKLIDTVQEFQMNGKEIEYEISGRDEIAALAKSFKFMSAEITQNVLKLQQEQEKLEARVFQRTAELHEAQKLLIKSNEELRIQSTTDRFTGLANRASLEDCLVKEIARNKREKKPFGVILIDIDNFKTINDNYGHDGGDEVITIVVSAIRDSIREIDLAGRWGGDEFLIICPKTEIENILEVAARIRTAIHDRKKLNPITASLGVTLYRQGDEKIKIVKRADIAMYEAKKFGKNCVKVQL